MKGLELGSTRSPDARAAHQLMQNPSCNWLTKSRRFEEKFLLLAFRVNENEKSSGFQKETSICGDPVAPSGLVVDAMGVSLE
ncbi:MAG: hypothetical protein AAGD07_07910 [Planctomycetota bacterium]